MRKGEADLHGNAPDKCEVALLLIDVINDLEFPGGDRLQRNAKRVATELPKLKARARAAGVPCIYANDNFGKWRSDFSAQVRHCLQDNVRGEFLVQALRPDPEDYFVLKPKHSAFYQTCLELLLEHLGVRTLILAGLATDNCVTFTANDAFLRGYSLVLVSDGCAAIESRAHSEALKQMTRLLHARTVTANGVTFARSSGQPQLRLAGQQRPRRGSSANGRRRAARAPARDT